MKNRFQYGCSGFRQKAALFNFSENAALCRDAAKINRASCKDSTREN
jgi:hypothetical protein